MPTYRFTVADMDCSEEVRALERELLPLVTPSSVPDPLLFNIISRTLTVTVPDAVAGPSPEILMAAVARTGMRAIPLDDSTPLAPDLLGRVGCACCGGQAPASCRSSLFFRVSLRELLCAASGLFIVLGLALQWSGLFADGFALGFGAGSVCLLVAALLGVYIVLPKAWYALRHAAPDMNLLMVTAVIGAVALGDVFEAAMVSFLFAVSNLLESWSTNKARHAVQKLLDISPRTALVYDDDSSLLYREYPVDAVPVGARLLVRPGDSVPVDGTVILGRSFVNQASITGESSPVVKEAGLTLYAGSLNGDGALTMRADRTAHDSTLSRILRMVEEAQSGKARAVQWVDKFAAVYTPIMMGLALALAVIPSLLFGGWNHWIYQALVLLVIACPCALVISTPVCIAASLATAARHGVLIKGGIYLELPAHLDAVAMDKTGTLTSGVFRVRKIVPLAGQSEEDALRIAAALEAFISHPIALAVRDEASRQGVAFASLTVEDAVAVPGRGASGRISDLTRDAGQNSGVEAGVYHIGSLRFLEESLGADAAALALTSLTAALDNDALGGMHAAPENAVFLWNEQRPLGAIAAEDELRPETARAVAQLKALGVAEIVMLTGDGRAVAEAVGAQAGVTRVMAELLPEDKTRVLAEMRAQGRLVAMVGDGVNDAPALASAELGIAMGAAGSDVAMETADIVLMSDDLGNLPWLVRLSKRNMTAIRTNITFALGLKATFAIMAVCGIASLWMAVIADVGATLLVVANGMRLLRAPAPGSSE